MKDSAEPDSRACCPWRTRGRRAARACAARRRTLRGAASVAGARRELPLQRVTGDDNGFVARRRTVAAQHVRGVAPHGAVALRASAPSAAGPGPRCVTRPTCSVAGAKQRRRCATPVLVPPRCLPPTHSPASARSTPRSTRASTSPTKAQSTSVLPPRVSRSVSRGAGPVQTGGQAALGVVDRTVWLPNLEFP
jgi:hypothetical protein